MFDIIEKKIRQPEVEAFLVTDVTLVKSDNNKQEDLICLRFRWRSLDNRTPVKSLYRGFQIKIKASDIPCMIEGALIDSYTLTSEMKE
jgi:hypothetical protein